MATRLIVNAGSWAGAWGTYWAGSWGIWGYNAGGDPILVEEKHSGGPDSNSRGRSVEREERELEHLERQAEHSRRMYAKPVEAEAAPAIETTPDEQPVPTPSEETPAPNIAIDLKPATIDLAMAKETIAEVNQLIEATAKRRREEEELLLSLLVTLE